MSERSGRGGGPIGRADPGLQPERTVLAWRRTVLTTVAGAFGAARLYQHTLGPIGYIVAALIAVVGVAAYRLVRRRHDRVAVALHDGDERRPRVADPRAEACVAAAVTVLGAGCLAYVALTG